MDDDDNEYEQLRKSIDTFWVLWGGCQVFFMQTGFSMLEVGSVLQNCTINVLIKNILNVTISAVCWALVGYAMAFCGSVDNFGIVPNFSQSFINRDQFAQCFFQWGFVATAATILSGAVAERIKFKAYVEYTIIMCALTYPIIVHCVWSTNGVFSKDRDSALFGCGVLDFAGSGVVHVTGGLASLIAVYLMGPRDCVSYDEKGVKTAPLGQSEVFKTLGTLCLWFGWFGFNGASTIYLVGYANIAARALVMTTVSGGTAGLISGAIWIYFSGDNQINITPALNGILTGLVGITANCATVELEGAFLIGIGSGIAYSFMVYIMDKYQIDDVVQAAQVHMGGGIWGLVAGGFFTSPKLYKEAYNDVNDPQKCAGVLYGGSGAQLGANLVFLAMCSLWIICSLGTFFYYQHVNNLLRVTLFTEKVGVDRVLHNANMAIDEAALESTIGHLNDTDSLVMKQS